MSNITNKDIKKIERLSKIWLSSESEDKMSKQLNDIIGWVSKLSEVSTDNVEPLTSVHGQVLMLHKDEVLDGNIVGDVLKNAKDVKYEYFTVPKVIE